MSRPLWIVSLLKKAFPSRFFLAKVMRRLPVVRKLADYLLFRGDAIVYLPKDQVIQVNEALSEPQDITLPSKVVEWFIEQAEDLWIMNTCICREAAGCQDYPVDLGCLFMGESVRQINPKLGYRATRAQALAHVQRARAAGLVHMIGRNRLDSVWLGARPYDKLLTVCNCCPCCCLWRVLPELPDEISSNVSRMDGVRVEVTGQCVGCGLCTEDICFVDAIRLENDRAVISDACRGCGRCVEVCPQNAITISLEDQAFVEHTVSHLSQLVDLVSGTGME